MPSESINLQSQVVVAYNGTDDLATSGPIVSGDFDYFLVAGGSAAALRFPLPEDFNSTFVITNATLVIHARKYDSIDEPTDPQRHQFGVLASGTQNLPTTASGVQTAALGTNVKTIGSGSYSPVLNHILDDTFTTFNIDLTDAFTEALSADRLDGTHVVILLQPVNYSGGAYIRLDGLTETDLPVLELTWAESGPVYFLFDDIEITSDGVYLDCSVDSGSLIADPTGNPENFLYLETSSSTPVTVAYHSGNASGTLRFLLSRMVDQNEVLTLTHFPGFLSASINRGAEVLENFEDLPIINNSVMRGPVLIKSTETLSQGYLVDFRIADVANSETLSEGDPASFIVDALMENSETFSETTVIDVRIVVDALIENSETISEGDNPPVEVISIFRPSLIPSQLFGVYPCRIF